MKKEKNKTWEEAFIEKMQIGWSRIDRLRFQRDFMVCQYEEVTAKFNPHGEPLNEKAINDYFHKIRHGKKPATVEAKKYAEDFFQINR